MTTERRFEGRRRPASPAIGQQKCIAVPSCQTPPPGLAYCERSKPHRGCHYPPKNLPTSAPRTRALLTGPKPSPATARDSETVIMFLRKGWPSPPVDAGERRASPVATRAVRERAVVTSEPGSNNRSCCCPAPPRVRVFLPSTGAASGPDGVIDILLCAHHYRASAERLKEIGAVSLGTDGGSSSHL